MLIETGARPSEGLALACRRANIDSFPPGCLRHFLAVTLYEATKDLLAVQRRLRHQDAKTTQHYLQSLIGA